MHHDLGFYACKGIAVEFRLCGSWPALVLCHHTRTGTSAVHALLVSNAWRCQQWCVCVSHVSLSGVRGMQEHYHLYLWTLGCGDRLRQSSPAANAAVFSEQEMRLLVLFCVSTSRSRDHRPIASHECESSRPFIVCQKHVFLNHTDVPDGMFIAGDGLQTPLVFCLSLGTLSAGDVERAAMTCLLREW
jgi:hypothetical protein